MKPTAFLILSLASVAAAAEPAAPKTLLAQPEKLLFADDLHSTFDKAQWRAAKGKWEIVDGALRGAELKADKHGAVTRHSMKMQDFVLSFDVKLDGARSTSVTINDAKEHVARALISANAFIVRRDDHDHDGPDKAVTFLNKKMPVETGKWHTVVMEMVGDTLVVTLDDGVTGFGSDELFKTEKANPGFTVAGETASFRNVRIWAAKAEPKSTWAATRTKLAAK
jgi:hypothetical protein